MKLNKYLSVSIALVIACGVNTADNVPAQAEMFSAASNQCNVNNQGLQFKAIGLNVAVSQHALLFLLVQLPEIFLNDEAVLLIVVLAALEVTLKLDAMFTTQIFRQWMLIITTA